jgi:membrane complex biogenesis BtpA family protein
MRLPRLIGVVHLAPLIGAPRFGGDMEAVAAQAARDAEALADFDAVMVENFGDTPFAKTVVEPATVAAMTRCVLAVRQATTLPVGINVLRNDARSALSIAAASGATMVRINVHVGARVTDQGIIEGDAHDTLRLRQRLGGNVALLCDVAVKHSAAITPRPIAEEARECAQRAMADAILVTGNSTAAATDDGDIASVLHAVDVPIYIASGATEARLPVLLRAHPAASQRAAQGDRRVHGVIVGSCLRKSGRAGDPIDPEIAKRFAAAFREASSD